MDLNEQRLRELSAKLERLSMQHQKFALEIKDLREEIKLLAAPDTTPDPKFAERINVPVAKPVENPVIIPAAPKTMDPPPVRRPTHASPKEKSALEEFIGTNLLNKVGIAVLVLGLAIGAKYAIDHNMISPLTRIVLGYIAGAILIVIAIRLKPKFLGFSAVLLSGGMAVLYFMTYAAYGVFDLIPQMMAFVLMVLFTAFTVFASLQYNLKAVAIIGLVGAYAVPFLLSDGSGRVVILFTYMCLINAGILVLSFKKAWKELYYTAFGLTWLIFTAWFFDQFYVDEHLWISLIFSTMFFITFYATFLSYKLLQGEPLKRWDLLILLFNSFIYYGFGYFAIADHEHGGTFLGLFTLFNALLHFIACYIIFRKQNATRDTFYFVAGMVLVFLTLAVPVQLEGHWVTLIWASEAVLLFWIGRQKNFPVYERLSYILMLLTFFSLQEDWQRFYPVSYYENTGTSIAFLRNIQILSSLLICASWGWILYISDRKKIGPARHWLTTGFSWGLPIMLAFTLYLSFYKEIDAFWLQRYHQSEVKTSTDEYGYNIYDTDLLHFNTLWLMIYSAVFLMSAWIVNTKWIKNRFASLAITGFSAFLIVSFLTMGLYASHVLRTSYLLSENAEYYYRDYGHILIRYAGIAFMLPVLWLVYKGVRENKLNDNLRKAERIFFHLVVLLLLSSELINILDLTHIGNSDGLALTILWGVYALGLVVYGLNKAQSFIRITAIGIFTATLIKLFLYDFPSMTTISKTIVMVTLGILLLVASFVYNKFKASENESQS